MEKLEASRCVEKLVGVLVLQDVWCLIFQTSPRYNVTAKSTWVGLVSAFKSTKEEA